MKAHIGGDRWMVAVGVGGYVIADGKKRAEQIEHEIFMGTVSGVVIAVILGFGLCLWLAFRG